MTDYNRWSRFNEDEVSKSIDERDEILEQEKRSLTSSLVKHKQIDEIKESNEIALEILASKVCCMSWTIFHFPILSSFESMVGSCGSLKRETTTKEEL
jgi:hypothetical protein